MVRTSRRGRDNPGSTPGAVISPLPRARPNSKNAPMPLRRRLGACHRYETLCIARCREHSSAGQDSASRSGGPWFDPRSWHDVACGWGEKGKQGFTYHSLPTRHYSPHWGLNPGPSVYRTDALPLSYRGCCGGGNCQSICQLAALQINQQPSWDSPYLINHRGLILEASAEPATSLYVYIYIYISIYISTHTYIYIYIYIYVHIYIFIRE